MPRHSHGWLSTKPFADKYSPDSMPAVASYCSTPHCSVCSAAFVSGRMSAGSDSDSTGTLPGLFTSSKLLHAVTLVPVTPKAKKARRIRDDILNISRSPRLVGETERGDEACRRRHDRLEAVRARAHGTSFRIPHVLVVDVDVDLAVARRVPTLLRRPQHREI